MVDDSKALKRLGVAFRAFKIVKKPILHKAQATVPSRVPPRPREAAGVGGLGTLPGRLDGADCPTPSRVWAAHTREGVACAIAKTRSGCGARAVTSLPWQVTLVPWRLSPSAVSGARTPLRKGAGREWSNRHRLLRGWGGHIFF